MAVTRARNVVPDHDLDVRVGMPLSIARELDEDGDSLRTAVSKCVGDGFADDHGDRLLGVPIAGERLGGGQPHLGRDGPLAAPGPENLCERLGATSRRAMARPPMRTAKATAVAAIRRTSGPP